VISSLAFGAIMVLQSCRVGVAMMNGPARLRVIVGVGAAAMVLSSCGGSGSGPSSIGATASTQSTAPSGTATANTSSTSPASTESYSAPATEGPSSPVRTTRGSAGHGRSTYGVNGPSLGNDSGVWNNWGYMNRASDGGVTPAGQVAVKRNVSVFLYSDDIRSALVTDLTVTPKEGPFRILDQQCSGRTIDAVVPGSSDVAAATRKCVVTVAFAPRRPAPAHADSPYQGYYHGQLVFTVQTQCGSRTGQVCAQIPSAVPVDPAHVRVVTWTTADDLWGATQCPLANPEQISVNGCVLPAWTSSSAAAGPTTPSAPTPSPRSPTQAPRS
jgi:hypothetical protein